MLVPVIWKITFSSQEKVKWLTGTRGNYYQFPDASRLEVLKHPVWCAWCRAFVEGERLKSLQELEKEAADYADVNSAKAKWVIRETSRVRDKVGALAKRLAESNARLAWLKERMAPPKCLECGFPEIIDLGDGQEVPSPCSSGTLVIGGVMMCSTAFRNYLYTPEGDRLPTEAEPTHWRMRDEPDE